MGRSYNENGNLGKRVEYFRFLHGLSQKRFAERAGVATTTITYLEKPTKKRHGKLTLKTKMKIEKALEGGHYKV